MSPKNAAKGETIVQPAHHLTGSGRFSVFVSYRTVDSAYTALLLQRDLTLRARSGRVFIDTGCIEFGDSIWQRIEPALNECDLVVVLIGPNWDEVVDDNKRRILEE